jgi:predicted O-linked N-acetylglucosamine transferase (SPINDLY family)
MATSLLHAIGAPAGITTSLSKYVETAVRLANDPMEYARYKAIFTAQAWRRTIGDIASFTSAFEDTWSRLVGTIRDS